jgi:hypothetical protein
LFFLNRFDISHYPTDQQQLKISQNAQIPRVLNQTANFQHLLTQIPTNQMNTIMNNIFEVIK